MSRIPRNAFALQPGCFHVINRGNNGMDVFRDEIDYQHYLNLLRHYKRRYPAKVYAYCLMTNHIHLLMETMESRVLPKVMHGLNLAYSLYYKDRYGWNGHLWQDRYKSYLIEKEKYLVTCIEYIESNPVKAGLVSNGEAYLWCSAQERDKGNKNSLLDAEKGTHQSRVRKRP